LVSSARGSGWLIYWSIFYLFVDVDFIR
jgi:hypothetical protein